MANFPSFIYFLCSALVRSKNEKIQRLEIVGQGGSINHLDDVSWSFYNRIAAKIRKFSMI